MNSDSCALSEFYPQKAAIHGPFLALRALRTVSLAILVRESFVRHSRQVPAFPTRLASTARTAALPIGPACRPLRIGWTMHRTADAGLYPKIAVLVNNYSSYRMGLVRVSPPLLRLYWRLWHARKSSPPFSARIHARSRSPVSSPVEEPCRRSPRPSARAEGERRTRPSSQSL